MENNSSEGLSPLEIWARDQVMLSIHQVIDEIKTLFENSPIDAGHDINHAIQVMHHVAHALKVDSQKYTSIQGLSMLLAALLHDVDDRKFFPESKDYENAKQILKDFPSEVSDLTLKMIRLVSCSENGNSAEVEPWMLYPRWADRLESIGEIGIYRCWVYTLHVNRPYFNQDTPRPQTLEELENYLDPERFENYISKKGKVGKSSMIDHYYDKVLHLKVETPNEYFNQQFETRHQVIVDFVLKFGQTGEIDDRYLNQLKNKFSSKD